MIIINFIRFICIKITFTSLGHRTLQLEFPFVEAYLEKEKKKVDVYTEETFKR